MGAGGISIWQLLIVLAIILLLFGTKKLRNLGGDLGGAIKGFKKSMKDETAKIENGTESNETEPNATESKAEPQKQQAKEELNV